MNLFQLNMMIALSWNTINQKNCSLWALELCLFFYLLRKACSSASAYMNRNAAVFGVDWSPSGTASLIGINNFFSDFPVRCVSNLLAILKMRNKTYDVLFACHTLVGIIMFSCCVFCTPVSVEDKHTTFSPQDGFRFFFGIFANSDTVEKDTKYCKKEEEGWSEVPDWIQSTGPPRHRYYFSCKEIYGLKVKMPRETHGARPTSISVHRRCFLTSKPFLAHVWRLFAPIWLAGVEGLIPLVSPRLDARRWLCWWGPPPLTAVSYIVCTQAVSRYIRTVPATAKRAFLNNIVYESTFVCVCACMCASTCSVHHGGGGQLRSLFGVRLQVSDIHHGRYPAGPHMNTCVEANAFTSIASCGKCRL